MTAPDVGVETARVEPGSTDEPETTRPAGGEASPSTAERRRPGAGAEKRFWLGVAGAAAAGAVIRFAYLLHGAPDLPLGDGFSYHTTAHRLAAGLGYTDSSGAEFAHHPPAWDTVLAAVTEAGFGSTWAHQVTGLVIGLGVIVVAGLVGRRYVSRRVGVIAAALAAAYPGFWVLEVQILSEPLGLLVVGVLMLVMADLWERPTLGRAALAGAVAGALALVRSEQLALLVLAVAPVLLLNRRLAVPRRIASAGVALGAVVLVLAPWTLHNLARFEEPVLLSTNGGTTLLAGNCPPDAYGDLRGSYHIACNVRLAMTAPSYDRSQIELEARATAVENMRDNVELLPATVAARHGRMLGVFRPAQTVDIAATWLGSARWPVWAWVASFWLIVPLAAYGSLLLRRSHTFQWPLVAPLVIVVLAVTVTYGEPRYHTPADLGLLVLAAVAVEHLRRRIRFRGAT
jgi:hypothetical protein